VIEVTNSFGALPVVYLVSLRRRRRRRRGKIEKLRSNW
jgi:hypothetical protein